MKPTYEELEVQIKQMEADNEKAMSVLKEANDAVLLAKSKFDALAAENAGLKALIPENWQMHDALHQLIVARPGGVYFNKWEKLIVGVLNATPATDAFLAEVRAQGVEMLAKKFRNDREALDPEIFAFGEVSEHFNKAAIAADKFAAQIRKGVQS